MKSYDIIVIGGGAAGFFCAINIAERNPNLNIAILERGKEVLTKVKISGGGRCNVTHAEFVPKELTQHYPRGEKELLGPFHHFMTGDTIAWFEQRGIELKTEADGRMFPVTDSSQTIIDCFLSEVKKLGVDVLLGQSVKNIMKLEQTWKLTTNADNFSSSKLIVATGSNPKVWKLLETLGHTIVNPVPSLFTFNSSDSRISDLPGIATEVTVKVLSNTKKVVLESEGPLLITHWGMSGPAILKLSAWGARLLAPTNYHFNIVINWLLHDSLDETVEQLVALKLVNPKQTLHRHPQFALPKRLWQNLLKAASIDETDTWAAIPKKKLRALAEQLTRSEFEVTGKSIFKEEFVTAGGIELNEVDFRTFESKLHPTLYFAGEVLNIDAITGGFNFQNAWTGGYVVAKAITA